MATLQVRDIDDRLYGTLKRRADREHRSLSQEVLKILESSVQQPDRKCLNVTAEFLSLCGSWRDRRSADAIVTDIRRHRKGTRRFGRKHVVFD